jgi:hypothetical protein
MERERAVAQERLHEERHRPERGVFPAAVRRREQPAVAGVGPCGADQYGNERQRDDAGRDTGDEQDAADELGRERRVAQHARKAQRREELRGARQREDEILEQCMGDEHRAQGNAQRQRCGGGIA